MARKAASRAMAMARSRASPFEPSEAGQVARFGNFLGESLGAQVVDFGFERVDPLGLGHQPAQDSPLVLDPAGESAEELVGPLSSGALTLRASNMDQRSSETTDMLTATFPNRGTGSTGGIVGPKPRQGAVIEGQADERALAGIDNIRFDCRA